MPGKPPSPFASAKRVTPASATSKGSIYIAEAVIDAKGRELFSQIQTKTAIETYVDGDRQAKTAKTMMETSRPIIDALAISRYTREWAQRRVRPDNPKVVSEPGGGATVTYIVQDRAINVTDDEKARIAALVGVNVVDECVVAKDIFTLNSEVLDQTVEITVTDAKGKKSRKTDTVQNLIAESLQETFKEHADLLAALFTVKPVQQTAKGLIERGLELSDPSRLSEFLDVIKAPTQIKAVGA